MHRDRSDSSFHDIVIELNATVIKESGQCRPAPERIPDGFSQRAVRRNTAELLLKPRLHGLDNRPGVTVSSDLALQGRLPADLLLDLI